MHPVIRWVTLEQNLVDANLEGVNLKGADLQGAKLDGANLSKVLPSTPGSLTACRRI